MVCLAPAIPEGFSLGDFVPIQCFDTIGDRNGIRPIKQLDVGLSVLML